ncbi:hypothetical protein LTR84_001435 [Exophiala bonariae]|uniref:CENP-V/GFA domain-containing protein n=1 Tax=Exophiala bonariae TaxID=1690606 RepID=A0AAV9NG13_9EURO|nr:hypothetical protein LTR84_001435 [Exophiala bonariae]
MSTSNILLPSAGAKGLQPDGRATATCFCGAVQLLLPVDGPDLIATFICNCSDDHKIHASAFASNFVVNESATVHVRGQDKLTRYAQRKTIATGNEMANYFCSICGTLMYRVSSGYTGKLIPRIGTVDDFDVQNNQLRPKIEQFAKNRMAWFKGIDGTEVHEGNFFTGA